MNCCHCFGITAGTGAAVGVHGAGVAYDPLLAGGVFDRDVCRGTAQGTHVTYLIAILMGLQRLLWERFGRAFHVIFWQKVVFWLFVLLLFPFFPNRPSPDS